MKNKKATASDSRFDFYKYHITGTIKIAFYKYNPYFSFFLQYKTAYL